MNKLAKQYNEGLAAAREAVEEHNEQLRREFIEAGVSRKFIKKSLLPIPMPCPEDLNMKFVRRFMAAFNWKRVSRNTAGAYLDLHLKWIFFLLRTVPINDALIGESCVITCK